MTTDGRKYLEEYDILTSQITSIFEKGDIQEKGRISGKMLKLLDDCNKDNPLWKTNDATKNIINTYCSRDYAVDEQKRRQKFLGDFDYKHSEAYDLVLKYTSKNIGFKALVSLVRVIVAEEARHNNITYFPRETRRDKPCLYKFIQDHLDMFKEYFNAGTRIIDDECRLDVEEEVSTD